MYRLDTLKAHFMPSRSGIRKEFNRDVDFGYRQQRIISNLNDYHFFIDLLTKNDTIVLASVTNSFLTTTFEQHDTLYTADYLRQRNKFYRSSKSTKALFKELSMNETYAFYCGDGLPKTQRGKDIEQLVADENTDALTEMLRSINCETQAYGVAGFLMLEKNDYVIPYSIQRLITHIKQRNAELVTCSGCFSGIIEKIYNN